MKNYDVIVVGAGFAGATIAERLAAKDKKVLVIDKRNHVGGNAYDYNLEGVLVHQYGPHIFHTNSREVLEYLNKFTVWYKYEHRVLGHIDDKIVPIPFNFASIDACFDAEKAEKLKAVLIREYGENKKVPIMELLKNEDADVKELANFVFEKVFKYYTMKQWGLEASQVDAAVTARVPVNTSYDDRYFNDEYQYMPLKGYTAIFNNMLSSKNITVQLNTNVHDVMTLKEGVTYFNGEVFEGEVYYTGAVDELFNYSLGELPYRSVDLVLKKQEGSFQKAATENYPGKEEAFTRITEYKHFMNKEPEEVTYTHTEYPMAYDRNREVGNIPYYVISSPENQKLYESYVALASEYKNLHLIGRLAEYKYYNMDAIIKRALEVTE